MVAACKFESKCMNERNQNEGVKNPMNVQYQFGQTPIKNLDDMPVAEAELEHQAESARQCTVAVDYHKVRGTCSDERERIGLLSGERTIADRPSVWGGPNIYALYMAELTGFFGNSESTGQERLQRVTAIINGAGIPSGGHKGCAANGGVNAVLNYIGDEKNFVAIGLAAKTKLGNAYDATILQQVTAFARAAQTSKHYENWDESVLENTLGDEAGQALEILANVPHDAADRIWNEIDGYTVSQNKLYRTAHKRSFVFDDPYAVMIENVFAGRPDNLNAQTLLRHACMALDRAIIEAVPNRQISDITLTA